MDLIPFFSDVAFLQKPAKSRRILPFSAPTTRVLGLPNTWRSTTNASNILTGQLAVSALKLLRGHLQVRPDIFQGSGSFPNKIRVARIKLERVGALFLFVKLLKIF